MTFFNNIKFMNIIYILFFIILFFYLIQFSSKYLSSTLLLKKENEGFSSFILSQNESIYPKSLDEPGILNNQFPFINRKKITSKNNYNNYWWKIQNTKNSNYQQATNNFKHMKNPDISNSIPQEFSGIFYRDIKNKSNIIVPNAPVPDIKNAIRIGYFNSLY
jgi:hypothetical protein